MTLQIWPDLYLYEFLKYFRMRQPWAKSVNNGLAEWLNDDALAAKIPKEKINIVI